MSNAEAEAEFKNETAMSEFRCELILNERCKENLPRSSKMND